MQFDEVLKGAIREAVLRFLAEKRPAHQEEPKSHVVEWSKDIKMRFVEWLRLEGKDNEYIRQCTRYLDRFIRPISSPADVIAMFSECRGGRQHLDRGFRNLLKFYRKMGLLKAFTEDLKEAIHTIKTGVDTYVPTDENVISTLRALEAALLKY